MIRSIGPVYAQNLVRGFGVAVRYHRRGVAAPVLRQPGFDPPLTARPHCSANSCPRGTRYLTSRRERWAHLLTTVLIDGLDAADGAVREALDVGVANDDLVLTISDRRREPPAPEPITTSEALAL